MIEKVFQASGLFESVSSDLKNGSNHGIDLISKTKSGDYVPIEVKTSARSGRRWLELLDGQNMGADPYTRKQIAAARTWGNDAANLADQMRNVGAVKKFNGYVYQISQFGSKNMQVNSYDWVSNLNAAAIRNKVKL